MTVAPVAREPEVPPTFLSFSASYRAKRFLVAARRAGMGVCRLVLVGMPAAMPDRRSLSLKQKLFASPIGLLDSDNQILRHSHALQ